MSSCFCMSSEKASSIPRAVLNDFTARIQQHLQLIVMTGMEVQPRSSTIQDQLTMPAEKRLSACVFRIHSFLAMRIQYVLCFKAALPMHMLPKHKHCWNLCLNMCSCITSLVPDCIMCNTLVWSAAAL